MSSSNQAGPPATHDSDSLRIAASNQTLNTFLGATKPWARPGGSGDGLGITSQDGAARLARKTSNPRLAPVQTSEPPFVTRPSSTQVLPSPTLTNEPSPSASTAQTSPNPSTLERRPSTVQPTHPAPSTAPPAPPAPNSNPLPAPSQPEQPSAPRTALPSQAQRQPLVVNTSNAPQQAPVSEARFRIMSTPDGVQLATPGGAVVPNALKRSRTDSITHGPGHPPYKRSSLSATTPVASQNTSSNNNTALMTSINASLEQHVAQLGGLNALKADLERPRYSNLMRACSRGDMFYLVMHQLFCLWSLNRTPVHSVVTSLRPGTTDPTWVDKGFDALSKILRSNNDLDQAHVQWFARFPYSEGMQPVYTPTAKLLLKFLEPLAFRWHAMLREASARQFPITAHEMIYVLHCLSPIMRSALFTVSRRSLGIPDNIAKPIIDLFEEEEAVEQQSLTQAPGNIGQLRDRFVTTYKLRVTYCRQRASSATSSPAQSRRPSMQAMQLHRSSSGSMPSATTPGHVQHSPHPGQHPSAGAGWTMPAVPPQHILGPSPSNTPMQSPGMPPPQPGQPFGQPQHHGQPQYGQPQHGQPQYGQSQYGHPQHGQPQYGQPQNVQSQHTWARGDQPVEQQLYQMIQSHHTLSQQGTPNQHQQMHTAYQPPHQQVPHQSPHQQPQHQQFQQPQHSHNMSGGQVMAAQQQAHGQAITNRGGFSSPMEYQSQPMPLPGPASPAIPHPANRSPATTAQTQTPNGASGSGSGNGSQQARSFRPIHEYEYPAGPFDWSSFRIAAHLTRPRSPQRVPAEGTSLQRHYQYVSGFAVNPTRIDAETGLRWLEFSLDDDDVANLPSKYVGISGLPTRSFFHGCTRYRLRCCVLSKESVFSSSEEEENAQQEQGGPLRVRRTDWVVKETRWPGEVYVFINDQPVDTAYRQHFHHDLPTELSDHVVPGRNVVQLSVPASATNRFKGPGADDKTYFFAVERILTASHSKLRRAIKANPHISEAETRADIIRRTAQAPDDDDIIIEDRTLRIGVTDPFSSVLFDVPVRGVACRHLECFDLDNWLNSRTSKPPDKTGHEPCAVDSWRCPICGKDARPSSLRIDDYFVAVRRELLEKGLKRTRTIRGATDGSWTAVPEAHDDSDADDAEEYAGLAPGPAAQATKAAASGTTDSNAVTRTTETNADSITVAVPNGDTATATPDAGDKRDSQAAIEVIEIDD